MDDFADLLKYIVPLAIAIGVSIFKKADKEPEKKVVREEPEYKYRSAADVIPKPDLRKKKKKKPASQVLEEGERAIVTEEPETAEIIEAEPEKPVFDAREAVIYSTILERKY